VLRRTWPESLVGWIRLLDGRLRDPRVGRDVMLGLLAGLGTAVVLIAVQWSLSLTSLPQATVDRWDDGGIQTDAMTLGGWPWSILASWVNAALRFGARHHGDAGPGERG
jgi:hypothetical protein